jgi:oligosaccharide repeat unit polymerase
VGSLDLVAYVPVAFSTYVLLLAANVTFAIGAFVGLGAGLHGVARAPRRLEVSAIDRGRFEMLLLALLGFGLVGFVLFLRAVDELFGVAIITSDLGFFRSRQNTDEYTSRLFFIKFLLYVNWLTPSLTVMYFVVFGRDARRWLALVFLLSAATTLFSAERSSFVFILLTSFFTWYYTRSALEGRPSVKGLTTLVLVVCLGVWYYVGLGEIMGKSAENMTLHIGGVTSTKAPQAVQSLIAPYVTLTGNIAGFQVYLNKDQHLTWGLFTVLPVTKVLAQLRILKSETIPAEVLEMLPIPFDFNTCTYLYVYYTDWGYPGVLLAPAAIGFVCCWVYRRMRAFPTTGLIIICAMVAHNLIMSVAVNRFIQTPFWLFLTFVPVINWWVRVPRRKQLARASRLRPCAVSSAS